MSKIRSALDAKDAHITTLRAVIGTLFGALLFACWGWAQAPSRITVDIPPDLSSGSSQKIGERLPGSVFQFAHYIFQQLNSWPVSGDKDYLRRIDELACYLTPTFEDELRRDYAKKERRNELVRTRYLQELPGHGFEPRRVYIEGAASSWVTFHDVKITEEFNGEIVKDLLARFSLRTVAWNTNPECNPFGLALDSFYTTPRRLEASAAPGDVRDVTGEEI